MKAMTMMRTTLAGRLLLALLLTVCSLGASADGLNLNLTCTVPITSGENFASCDGGSVHAVGRKVYVTPINNNFTVSVWGDNVDLSGTHDPINDCYNIPENYSEVTVSFRLRTQNVVVSFNMNGLDGTTPPGDQNLSLGQLVMKPQDLTLPDGTIFFGWTLDKNSMELFDFDALLDHTLPYTYKSSDKKFHLTLYAAYRFLVNSGTCGKEDETHDGSQLTWKLYKSSDAGNADYLIISGNGEMADNLSDNWRQVKTAVIEDGVTTIGKDAFYGCMDLTSVSFPASLITIGEGAFLECRGLMSVSLPANLTTIGKMAFDGCTSLKSVFFPASLTTIAEGAFAGCKALPSVSIPASVTTIDVRAFFGCTGLQSVALNSNPFIGNAAFYGVGSVTMNLTANAGGDAYWMTFYNKHYGFTVADATNTQVFTATLSGDQLTLNPVEGGVIPADNPVILKSASANLMLTKNQQTSTLSNNSLQGTTATITNPGANNYYVLGNGTGGVGFYKLANNGTIGVGKAYLTYTAGAREFFAFNDATNIDSLTPDPSPNGEGSEYYDLQGRRVAQPQKGLYIVDGRLIIK